MFVFTQRSVLRHDVGGRLKPLRRTPAGYLEVDAPFSRTGVYEYPDPTIPGGVRRELRLEEDVFATDSLEGFRGVPVTREHPPKLLTMENAARYARGTVLEPARRDGDLAMGHFVIHDQELAREVESGERDGISPGYICDLEPAPEGMVVDGKEIHALQRRIRPNHLAVVEFPRGGDRIRIGHEDAMRLDGLFAGGEDAGSTSPTGALPPGDITVSTPSMKRITIDGISGEVPEHLAEAFERHQKARLDSETVKDQKIAAAEKQATEQRARADALDADLKKAKEEKARVDGELVEARAPKAVAAMVKRRVSIEKTAGRVLGRTLKLDGRDVPLSEVDDSRLCLAVLQKRVPGFNLDALPEAQRPVYLEARFAEEARRIDAATTRRDEGDAGDQGGEHTDEMVECPKCGGTGELEDGTECPMCGGTGKVEPAALDHADSIEPRRIRGDDAPRTDALTARLDHLAEAGLLPSQRSQPKK